MSDDQRKTEAGLALRHAMFGAAGAEDQVNNASDYMAPMQDIVTRICFGEGWQRPGFDRSMRSLLTVAMLMAMGRSHEIKIHTRGATANGDTREALRGRFLHGFPYRGMPLLDDPTRASEEILDELGAAC